MNDANGIRTDATVLVSFICHENEIAELRRVLQLQFGQMYVISSSYSGIAMAQW